MMLVPPEAAHVLPLVAVPMGTADGARKAREAGALLVATICDGATYTTCEMLRYHQGPRHQTSADGRVASKGMDAYYAPEGWEWEWVESEGGYASLVPAGTARDNGRSVVGGYGKA